MKHRLLLIAALAVSSGPVWGQIRVNLDHLAPKAKETVDINLNADTLRLASGFLTGGKVSNQPDGVKMQQALAKLKGITVKSFEFAQEGQYQRSELDPIRAQLAGPGWSKIVSATSPRELSEIYTKTEQGQGAGFAILSAEPKELTVILIEGSIDLNDLSGIAGELGIPGNLVPGAGKNKDKAKGKQ